MTIWPVAMLGAAVLTFGLPEPARAQVHVDVGIYGPRTGAHVVIGGPRVVVVDHRNARWHRSDWRRDDDRRDRRDRWTDRRRAEREYRREVREARREYEREVRKARREYERDLRDARRDRRW